ncbi:MAG TPA: septum formation initiator [Pseudonocardiaceae bacterium]|nr:septum formation initiator [Pseudonocardiaceae bacterium]
MTAPARVGGPASRTRTRTQPPRTQPRERGTGKPPAAQPERTTGTRDRSPAAERAYARRAQRSGQGAVSPVQQVERKPGSASRATFVITVMVLLVGGVVATLWFSTQATADAYRLEQAKNTTNQLQVQVGQLQQEVAQQDSPPSLAQRARQLGMIPAGNPAHLVVGPNGKVKVIGTPSVAEPPPPPPKSTTPPTSTPPASNSAKPPATTNSPTTTANPSTGG